MKWIDFDKLEGFDEEEIEDLEEDIDRLFFEELTDGHKVGEEEDEDYWRLPAESMKDIEQKNMSEEEYIYVPGAMERQGGKEDDIVHEEEEYVRIPVEEEEIPASEISVWEQKREAEHFVVEAESENLYDLPEDEAESITLDEKRVQIGRMLGLGVVQEENIQEIEQAVQEDSSGEDVTLEEDEFDFDFESVASQYIEQLQEEQEKHPSYDPHAYDEGNEEESGYEQFKESFGRKALFEQEENQAPADNHMSEPDNVQNEEQMFTNDEPVIIAQEIMPDDISQENEKQEEQLQTEPLSGNGMEIPGMEIESEYMEEEQPEESSFVDDKSWQQIEEKEEMRLLDLDEELQSDEEILAQEVLVDEDDFEEDEPVAEEYVTDSSIVQEHVTDMPVMEEYATDSPETPDATESFAMPEPMEDASLTGENMSMDILPQEEVIIPEIQNKTTDGVSLEEVPERKYKVVDIRDIQENQIQKHASSQSGVLQKRTYVQRTPERSPAERVYAWNTQKTPEHNQEENEARMEMTKQEKKPGIQKLQSAFEDEFENLSQDALLVRENRNQDNKNTKKPSASMSDKESKKRSHPLKDILSFVICILVVVAAVFLIVNYVGQRTQVSGSSMETTLHDGDNLIVDKISYRLHDPERFDIIVFPYKGASSDKETFYIKRIIGLPGERVRIENGFIYINGELLDESYGKDNELILNPGRASQEIKLADDEYFVLGDNRNNSSDSREIGNIKKDDIEGKAWLRIYPFDKIGILKHQ